MSEEAATKPKDLDASVTAIVEDPALILKRRSQIVAAATELFSTQGFYKTTIKDVAKRAGISSGLVYQYVREKEDVLLLVLLDVVDAYAREIPKALVGIEDPIARLVAAIEAYCRVIDRHREGGVLAYRSTKSLSPPRRRVIQQKEAETNALIAAEVKACMKAGLVRKVDLDVLVYHIVMAAHTWALKSWHFAPRLTLDAYIRETTDILMAGALTPEGAKHYAMSRKKKPR